MKQTPKKLLAILLAGVMLLPTLASCSEESSTNETDTTAAGDMTTSAETTPADPLEARKTISDDLPDVNMDGFDFRIYSNEMGIDCFYAEEEVGEPVNDAMFYVGREINERFGANIKVTDSGLPDIEHETALKTIITADEDAYDLASGHDAWLAELSLDSLFTNVLNLPYQNFDKPWWGGMEEFTFMDQCYLINSDMSIRGLKAAWVIFVNKEKMTDYGLEVPYKQVLEGKWSIDSLISMTKDVYEDLDADSEADDDDFYGYLSMPNCYGYLDSFGVQTLNREGDEVNIDFDVEKVNAIAEKIYQFLYESKGGRTTGGNNASAAEPFSEQKALFIQEQLRHAEEMFRFVEKLDYGILPMPKWDEAQEDYNTYVLHYPFVVPATVRTENYENVSIILEAYSAGGYKQTVPAYFETALKLKYTTDNESVQMLDIINETKSVSFSWAYEYWQGYNLSLYHLMFVEKSSNFMSYYESMKGIVSARAKKVQRGFEKMAEAQGLR